MEPLEILKQVQAGLLKLEPLHVEKRTQELAQSLLIAFTQHNGFIYANSEKGLQAAVSMSFCVADEFVNQANSRFDLARKKLEAEIAAKQPDTSPSNDTTA